MLAHDRNRLALSIGGIAFAVTVMFLQLGFLNGINDSQAGVARMVNADFVVLHKKRTTLDKWTGFEPIRLGQLSVIPGVREVIPIYMDGVGLRNPQTKQVRRIVVYAFSPEAKPFNLPDLADGALDLLKVRGNALFDVRSRDIYGTFQIGDPLDIDGKPYRVAGYVNFGPNLINDGTIFMSNGSWIGDGASARPVMAFLRLDGGGDMEKRIDAVRKALPDDLNGLTPEDLATREILYMTLNAPIGTVFAVGLLVSLVIGIVICYQLLFNEVTDNVQQYATLKAMGFGPPYLIGIILEEAVTLAIAGYIPGLLASFLIYHLIGDATRLAMFLTVERIVMIFALTVFMCITAGILAIRKVLKLDPAELF
jgi:putative ABC transport system permease protein